MIEKILSLVKIALTIIGTVATVFSCFFALIVFVNPPAIQEFIIRVYNPITPTAKVIIITQLAPNLPPLPTTVPITTGTSTTFAPPDNGILFQDDFDKSMSSEWTSYGGTWLVSNGELTLVADQGDAYDWIALNRPEWKNYALSLNINIPFQFSGAQSHIAIAVRNSGSQSKYIGVLVDSNSNVYWAFIGTDRFNSPPIAGRNSDIEFSSGSNLELDVQGNIYVVKINGREIQRITISGYDSGGISLGIKCYETAGCPSFDNVKITYLP